MYVWNLAAVRNQLRAGPLPQHDQIAYVIALTLLGWANAQAPFVGPGNWGVPIGVVRIAIVGFALFYVYSCNGGRSGERFLERFTSLAWVLMVRFFVLIELPLLALTDMYVTKYGPLSAGDLIISVIAVTLVQLLFYWLLGRQISAVASPAT